MTTEATLVVSEPLPIATPNAYDPGFEGRWKAWVAKGLVTDARSRAHTRIGMVIVALALAVFAAARFFAA